MTDWFARPVLHVSNVEASLRFYVDLVGFTVPWRVEWDGGVHIAEVDRQGCALILSDQWPEKVGKGLMFVSLNVEPATPEALFDRIRRHRPTVLVNVPTMIHKMTAHPAAAEQDLSCLRLCTSAGEALIDSARRALRELEIGRLLYPEDDYWRPHQRTDCVDGPRPCPFVSCKYHIFIDVSPRTGAIKLNFPDLEVWDMGESCALDVARFADTKAFSSQIGSFVREIHAEGALAPGDPERLSAERRKREGIPLGAALDHLNITSGGVISRQGLQR